MEKNIPSKVFLKLNFQLSPPLEVNKTEHYHSIYDGQRQLTADGIFTSFEDYQLENEIVPNQSPYEGSRVLVISQCRTNQAISFESSFDQRNALLLKIWSQIQKEGKKKSCQLLFRSLNAKGESVSHEKMQGMGKGNFSSQLDFETKSIEVSSKEQLAELLKGSSSLKEGCSILLTSIEAQTQDQSGLIEEISLKIIIVFQSHLNSSEILIKILPGVLNNISSHCKQAEQQVETGECEIFLKPLTKSVNYQLLFLLDSEEHLWNHPYCALTQKWCQAGREGPITEELRKQIFRQETIMKKVKERHKAILGVLSKCVNMQWSQVDRRFQLLLDCVTPGEKRSDKFKIASQKRQENDALIEQLQASIQKQEHELAAIREQQIKTIEKVIEQREQTTDYLARVLKQISELSNPHPKFEPEPSSACLYYPKQRVKKKGNEIDQCREGNSSTLIERGHLQSRKSLTKAKAERKQQKQQNHQLFSNGCHWLQRQPDDSVEKMKQEEIIFQLIKLLKIVNIQQGTIQKCLQQKGSLLSAHLKENSKMIQSSLNLNSLWDFLGNQIEGRRYLLWMKGEQAHQQWLLSRQKNQAYATVTTIKEL